MARIKKNIFVRNSRCCDNCFAHSIGKIGIEIGDICRKQCEAVFATFDNTGPHFAGIDRIANGNCATDKTLGI
jgi:hypothetical protein